MYIMFTLQWLFIFFLVLHRRARGGGGAGDQGAVQFILVTKG